MKKQVGTQKASKQVFTDRRTFLSPREALFVEELPLTPTGKIQRFRLRALAQEEKHGGVSG